MNPSAKLHGDRRAPINGLRFALTPWYNEIGRAIAKVPSIGFGQRNLTLAASPAF
jgi:hypothetical protein